MKQDCFCAASAFVRAILAYHPPTYLFTSAAGLLAALEAEALRKARCAMDANAAAAAAAAATTTTTQQRQ